MWRRTERASLEKKPSTRLSQEPCLGVKVNSKRPAGCSASQASRLLGDMRGMIVEDQLDRGVGRIGRVEELEELDELAAAVAILDQGVNLAGQQVDAGQQADRAVALVFMIARERRMHAGLRRQIRCRRCNRLDARLLVIGDDRHRITRLVARCDCGLLKQLHRAINAHRNPLRETSRGPVSGEGLLRGLYDLDPRDGVHVDPDPADRDPEFGAPRLHDDENELRVGDHRPEAGRRLNQRDGYP